MILAGVADDGSIWAFTDGASPAQQAGVRLGSVITAINSEAVDGKAQILERLARCSVGESVAFTTVVPDDGGQAGRPSPRDLGRAYFAASGRQFGGATPSPAANRA